MAIAYAVVAWLLIQAGSILFPTFEAPSWVMKVFVVALAAGFPIALVIAWAFEITPEGIKRAEDVAPNESTKRNTGSKLTQSSLPSSQRHLRSCCCCNGSPAMLADVVARRVSCAGMKLHLESLPASLEPQRATLARCLAAMDRALPLRTVYLFGSHARGDAWPDSDVDLCLVADGAERQLEASAKFSDAIWEVWPRPAFTLIPIAPSRFAEKRANEDHFFATVLKEGLVLAAQD